MYVAALALGAAASFGLALVLTQVGLRHLSPMRGASISVPCAALLFLVLAPALFDTAGFTTRSALLFGVSGCLFPAAVTLLTFEANRRVGPAITGALGNLSPLFAIAMALLVLGEAPRWGQLAGIGVILAGVLLIIGAPQGIPRQAFGGAISLLLLAAFVRGLVQPVVKLGLEGWPSPYSATLIGYVMSALVLLGFVGVREGNLGATFSRAGWLWFIPVGLLNGMAVLLMYAALASGPVAIVAPLVACYPLATLFFGRVLLGAGGVTRIAGFGVAITVAGVALLLGA